MHALITTARAPLLAMATLMLLSGCADKPPAAKLFSECNIDDFCFERQRSKISSWQELLAYYAGAQDRVDILGSDPDNRIQHFETNAEVCGALPQGLVRSHCEAAIQKQDCAALSKKLDALEEDDNGPAPDWRQLDACLIEEVRKRAAAPLAEVSKWCASQAEELVQICLQSYARLARSAEACTALDDPRVHKSCMGEIEALKVNGQAEKCSNPHCSLELVKLYREGLHKVTIDCNANVAPQLRLTDLSRDCEQWSGRAKAIQQDDLTKCEDYTCVVWFVTDAIGTEKPETGDAAHELAKRFCPADSTFPANQCRNALFNTLAIQLRDQQLCVEGYWNPAECQIRLLELGVPLADCETVGKYASTDLYRERTQQACQMIKSKLASRLR